MTSTTIRMLFAAALLASVFGCASKLKRDLTDHTPTGLAVEEAIDVGLVSFTELGSTAAINLKTYMQANGRDYLLLTFGSKGCAACNRKARHLTDDVIGVHPLFLQGHGRFEIIGVNTDAEPFKRLEGYLKQYPFIRWSDPAGLAMLQHFMPPGHAFSVPFTVMVSKTGIAWRVLPDEEVSVEQLVERVEVTLGTREAPATTGGGSGTGTAGGEATGTTGDGTTGDATTGNATTGNATTGNTTTGNATTGNATTGNATTGNATTGNATTGDSTTTGGGTGTGTTGTGGETTGTGTGTASVDLGISAAGRLGLVAIKDCRGVEKTLGATLGDADLRFVAIVRTEECDAACASQLAALDAVEGACEAKGTSCATAALFTQAAAADCAKEDVFIGGEAFVRVFESHFDWSHHPLGDFDLTMPPSTEPWLMGFAKDGTLVYSAEGLVATGALDEALAAPSFGTLVRGPDFAFYANGGAVGFADLRRRAAVTVVTAGGYSPISPCASCTEELQHWNRSGELFDYCAASDGGCQVLVQELAYRPATMTPEQFQSYALNGDGGAWAGLKTFGTDRFEVIIDPKKWDECTNDEYNTSFQDGYLTAKFPQFSTSPKTVVYDREGKIMAVYEAVPPVAEDPVLAKVKQLLGR